MWDHDMACVCQYVCGVGVIKLGLVHGEVADKEGLTGVGDEEVHEDGTDKVRFAKVLNVDIV